MCSSYTAKIVAKIQNIVANIMNLFSKLIKWAFLMSVYMTSKISNLVLAI